MSFGRVNAATTLAGLDFAISLASLEISVSLILLEDFLTRDSALSQPINEKLLLLTQLDECRIYSVTLSEGARPSREITSENTSSQESAIIGRNNIGESTIGEGIIEKSISAKEYRALVLESTAAGHF